MITSLTPACSYLSVDGPILLSAKWTMKPLRALKWGPMLYICVWVCLQPVYLCVWPFLSTPSCHISIPLTVSVQNPISCFTIERFSQNEPISTNLTLKTTNDMAYSLSDSCQWKWCQAKSFPAVWCFADMKVLVCTQSFKESLITTKSAEEFALLQPIMNFKAGSNVNWCIHWYSSNLHEHIIQTNICCEVNPFTVWKSSVPFGIPLLTFLRNDWTDSQTVHV